MPNYENVENSKFDSPEFRKINLVNQDIKDFQNAISEINIDPGKSIEAFELPANLEKIADQKEEIFTKLASKYSEQNTEYLETNPLANDSEKFTQAIYSFLMLTSIGQNYSFSYYGDPKDTIQPSKELLVNRYNLKKQLSETQLKSLTEILGKKIADKLITAERFYKFLETGGRVLTDLDKSLLPKLCQMSEKIGFKVPNVMFDQIDNSSNNVMSLLHKVPEFTHKEIDNIVDVMIEDMQTDKQV